MGDELIEKAQELKTMIQNSAEYQKYDSCRHCLLYTSDAADE